MIDKPQSAQPESSPHRRPMSSESIDALLGRAANEFMESCARGESPRIEDYAQRYPEISAHILRTFQALELARDTQSSGESKPFELAESKQLGDFRIRGELGRGGMGVVYDAEQISIGRRVALKVLPFAALADDQRLERFKNEVRAAGLLHHPHIVPVYSVGVERSVHFFAMQYIDGASLQELLESLVQKQEIPQERSVKSVESWNEPTQHAAPSSQTPSKKSGELPSSPRMADTVNEIQNAISTAKESAPQTYFRTVAKWIGQAAEALAHAHQNGILHRDIKPGNLLLDRNGHIWIVDFGLARIEQDVSVTMTGDILGTLRYMAPEQALAKRILIDHRADIYSLGATLYELVALRPVFTGENRQELIKQIAVDEPVKLRNLDRSVPSELETIIHKALAKNPDERYASAIEMADDLRAYREHRPIKARRPTLIQRTSKWARRHRTFVNTALAAFAVAVVAGGILLNNERDRTLAALNGETIQRRLAEQREEQANIQEREAQSQRIRAELNQYYAEIVSGQSDWDRGYLSRLHDKLVRHLPVRGASEDRRGWEWYYLWTLCRPESRTLFFPGRSPFATWSPDGEYIASSGAIWRANSGEPVRRFVPNLNARSSGNWSHDGRKYAWGTLADDSCIYIWDRDTDGISELRGHESSVWCVAWSPDGKQIASGGIGNSVRIWDVASKSVVKTLPTKDNVTDVSWSPDGGLLAAAVKAHRLKIWNADSHDVLTNHELPGRSGFVGVRLAWHPDGNQLALSTHFSWSLLRRPDWTVIRHHDLKHGHDIAWCPDGNRIAVADNTIVSIWNKASDKPVRTLRGHLREVVAVAWSPDGQKLVSSDTKEETRVWDLSSRSRLAPISMGGPIDSLAWLSNTTVAVTNQPIGSSATWDAIQGDQLSVRPIPVSEQVYWSRDRQIVAHWDANDGKPEVRVLEAQSGRVRSALRLDAENVVENIAWSHDGTKLAIRHNVGIETSVEFWDVDSETLLSTWEHRGIGNSGHIAAVWSPDGNRVALAARGEEGDNGTPAWQGHIYLVDVEKGQTLQKHNVGGWYHFGNVASLAWSPDGNSVVAGTTRGLVEAIQADTGSVLFSTRLHNEKVNSIAWSPDGRRLASASNDGTVKLLVAEDGRDLLAFPLGQKVKHVAWSSNGIRLAAATDSGELHVWDTAKGYEFSDTGRHRGELAWVYYRAKGDKQDRLHQVLKLAPDTREFWEMRGHVNAELGGFDRAAQEFAKAVGKHPKHSRPAAFHYACALLATGKRSDYRQQCRSMFEQLVESEATTSRLILSWQCSLVADDEIEPNELLALTRDHRDSLSRGAALYRANQYEEAAASLRKLADRFEQRAHPEKEGERAAALYFLSMARQQLGHTFQARRILDDAARIAGSVSSESRFLSFYPVWSTVVQLKVLDREANELIRE